MSKAKNSQAHPGQAGVLVSVGLVVFIVLMIVFVGMPHGVNAGETCVITRGGDIKGSATSGYTFVNAFEGLNCLSNRPVTVQAVIGDDKNNSATYKLPPVDASSADGQYIIAVPYTLTFHLPRSLPDYDPKTLLPLLKDPNTGAVAVPSAVAEAVANGTPNAQAAVATSSELVPVFIRENNVEYVYEHHGTSMDALRSLVKPRVENEVKTTVQLFTSQQLYSGDLTIPSDTLYKRLFPVFHGYGLWLESAKISTPQFNEAFVQKREERQLAEQNVEIAKQAAAKTAQDAQAARNQAQGEADSNAIRADGEKRAAIIQAEGQAEAVNKVAAANANQQHLLIDAYGGPTNYVAAKQAEASGNWNITTIMGSDSGILPVFQVPTPAPGG